MKLSVPSLSTGAAVLWALGFMLVASANLIWPPYGRAFLDILSSVYPGYTPDGTPISFCVGVLYAFLDGAVGGALLALFYNACAR